MMIQSHLENWERYYQPPSRLNWRGRVDGSQPSRFHEVTTCLDLRNDEFSDSVTPKTYGLIGFACDEGIRRNLGRLGAARGPDTCRQSFANAPIGQSSDLTIYDCGNVACWDEDLEASQQALADVVEAVIRHGIKPLVIGGGHETAWGHYQGLEKADPQLDCGIVNFDAHFDLRPLLAGGKGTSGTSFTQIAQSRQKKNLDFSYTCIGIQSVSNTSILFDKADHLNVDFVTAEDLHLGKGEKAEQAIARMIDAHQQLYVTVCLDVFSAAHAPGVSAPQPFGLSPWHVIPHLQQLARSNKVAGFDICELSPPFDRDDATAHLTAALIATFLQA